MRLFCFGLGYVCVALTEHLRARGIAVSGTTRDAAKGEMLRGRGVKVFGVTSDDFDDAFREELSRATHIVCSVPPDAGGGDRFLEMLDTWGGSSALEWIGYLSATSVYGDAGGGEVDEFSAVLGAGDTTEGLGEGRHLQRGFLRVRHESGWMDLAGRLGVAGACFRLSGIYGPGRNVLERVRAGRARRIVKSGHVMSRIHLSDIVTALDLAMGARAGGIFNLSDDEPASAAEVTEYACDLLGVPFPVEELWEDVRDDLSPMLRSFYEVDRRVVSRRTCEVLGWRPLYPSYREGLSAILREDPLST
ncbi:MAG: hypothetical protein MPJ52_06470 [Alphaproteobacteria bacterium]|nr:hypothetical protein [Alphaproteobacteria bacterium]